MNTFLLTWTCYGTWLHGDRRGSVDRHHNRYGDEFLEPDDEHCLEMREAMVQPPYELDADRREVVLGAIRAFSGKKSHQLHAVHVRWNHVHLVIDADREPRRLMSDIKAAASRALNRAGFEDNERRRWTRGGSRKQILDEAYFRNAVHYVLNKQGEPMSRWPA